MAEDQLHRLLQNAFALVKVVDAAVSELIDGLVLDDLRLGRSRACAGDGP
ncbi:hypothetical protein [Streptomyces olivaceoviridis]